MKKVETLITFWRLEEVQLANRAMRSSYQYDQHLWSKQLHEAVLTEMGQEEVDTRSQQVHLRSGGSRANVRDATVEACSEHGRYQHWRRRIITN